MTLYPVHNGQDRVGQKGRQQRREQVVIVRVVDVARGQRQRGDQILEYLATPALEKLTRSFYGFFVETDQSAVQEKTRQAVLKDEPVLGHL